MDKKILLEALVTEREGMLAENTQCLHLGESMAYGQEAFNQLASEIRGLASQPSNPADLSTGR